MSGKENTLLSSVDGVRHTAKRKTSREITSLT